MSKRVSVLCVIAIVGIMAVACDLYAPPSAPSDVPGATLSGPAQLASATVTVLDGAPPPSCVQGCTVTKWPLYPVEDWTPTYNVRTSASDACTYAFGSPWYTYALVDDDDDYLTPPLYWCKQ